MRYKTAFVINPEAGKGRSLKVWHKLEPLLLEAGEKYEIILTRGQDDGARIAEKISTTGTELVVGVGGDGTLLDLVNCIDIDRHILGIIPGGTGNGFRRSLNIPGNADQALAGLSEWEPRRVDLGVINGTYFLNVVGFGFDAAVAKMATKDYRIMRGYPAYVTAFFQNLPTFNSFSLTIRYGNQIIHEENTLLAAISNGRFYGGQLCIAPRARVDDGRLDVCLIPKTGAMHTVTVALRAFWGSHLDHDTVTAATGEEMFIDAPETIPVHIDGDIRGSLPAVIGIRPRALKVLAPPTRAGGNK